MEEFLCRKAKASSRNQEICCIHYFVTYILFPRTLYLPYESFLKYLCHIPLSLSLFSFCPLCCTSFLLHWLFLTLHSSLSLCLKDHVVGG